MPETTAADRQNACLNKARKLYSDGKFKAALAAFKEALLRCPCTRDVLVQSKKMGLSLKEIQISRCHCKDFESLPPLGSPRLAMYTLAKSACTCGSDVFHCNVASHLNALDGMIATYEKLEAPVKARQHATLLVITSPRVPEGYLRLAKALRMCDTEQSSETITRCRWIYRQAMQSVQTYGNKDHPKLKIMADLLRMDILGSVPAELQTMILANLGSADLCRSMRVSKTWKTASLDPSLWRHLTFYKTSSRKLRKGVFNKIITKRAQCKVKSLNLWGVDKLHIDLPTFKATLKALKQLESLSLKGSLVNEDQDVCLQAAPHSNSWVRTVSEEAPTCLKTLHIGGFGPLYAPNLWATPWAIPMAQSLEELYISHVTPFSVYPVLLLPPAWPKLRKLAIAASSPRYPLEIDLLPLAKRTPSLKDLSIHNFVALMGETTPSWESLERLELILEANSQDTVPAQVEVMHLFPRLCPTLRSLVFPGRALTVLRHYQMISQDYPEVSLISPHFSLDGSLLPPVTELERLEHLCLRDSGLLFARTVSGLEVLAWFMDLIGPSMSNGFLTSLAVTFCPELRFELDRVLNKDAILTLSCFDFLDAGPWPECGDDFAHWVQGFHNLTTLGVFPQKSECAWMHIAQVLAKESRIETIYTDVLKGQPRDWVLAKAREKGVKIVEASCIPEPVLQPLVPE